MSSRLFKTEWEIAFESVLPCRELCQTFAWLSAAVYSLETNKVDAQYMYTCFPETELTFSEIDAPSSSLFLFLGEECPWSSRNKVSRFSIIAQL